MSFSDLFNSRSFSKRGVERSSLPQASHFPGDRPANRRKVLAIAGGMARQMCVKRICRGLPRSYDLKVRQSAVFKSPYAPGWRQIFWFPHKKQDNRKFLALRQLRPAIHAAAN
jgi:hypothetical protein